MRTLLSFRLAAALLLLGAVLISFAGWSLSRTIEPGLGEVVVHVPRKFWPGSKPAPEMDEVVRRLQPGETIRIKLVFADARNDLATPQRIDIRRGSLTFHRGPATSGSMTGSASLRPLTERQTSTWRRATRTVAGSAIRIRSSGSAHAPRA